MLRLIFLLAPVFVCLFWAGALMVDSSRYAAPRRFLAWFLLFVSVIFLAHFFYFAPLPKVYPWFDIPLQWLGMAIFPMFHIYFRLLTVDEKFSARHHAKYLAVPVAAGLLYTIAVSVTPFEVYTAWLYNEDGLIVSRLYPLLEISRNIIRAGFNLLLFYTLWANHRLVAKFGLKAGEYYSDFQDIHHRNVRILNFTLLGISAVSLATTLAGRQRVIAEPWIIYTCWSAFVFILYVIGLFGIRQRPVNHAYDKMAQDHERVTCTGSPANVTGDLHERIMLEFEQNKIYLNNELNIIDLAKTVGSNRTYISAVINQHFNQNFTAFVNSYRVEELKRLVAQQPDIKARHLAQDCGFGSVNSMNRAIAAQTGMNFSGIRSRICEGREY